MKVVLLHDWLTGYRGGERVLEVFCEIFPDAPLYTLLYRPGSTTKTIENRKITTSFLNMIPGIHKHYRKFLPLFPLAAESLKIIEEADLVLSSSHCVIKGVRKPLGSKHISYIHSPMRYLYDQYDAYFGKDAPFYQRLGAWIFKNYLVKWDLASNANVDVPVANADFVQKRISKYYHLDSQVIHPFVDLADFRRVQKSAPAKKEYYLMVTAFAPNKRVDLAIETFNNLGKKLLVIGSGQKENDLRAMSGETIEFLGNLSRQEVVDAFACARALIFPGVEDFGITPLEALASGTPVIAYQTGGVLETLNEDVAEFFTAQTCSALEDAILRFEKKTFLREKLLARAEDFSKEKFKEKIEKLIAETLKN